MSNYNSTSQMVHSESLRQRVAAAAAGEGVVYPDQWARDQMWFLANDAEWVQAWSYAKETETLDHNPDTGARPGVINDGMILSVVQARINALKAVEPPTGAGPAPTAPTSLTGSMSPSTSIEEVPNGTV